MKKRFIAGAKCPACGEIDKLIVYKDEGDDYRECVECGFKEKMVFKPVVKEPVTRVNKKDSDVQVLDFPPDS